MNPHKLPPHLSYYTYDKQAADYVSSQIDDSYVGRYSMGDNRPRECLPYAVWTKGNGALLVNWKAAAESALAKASIQERS